MQTHTCHTLTGEVGEQKGHSMNSKRPYLCAKSCEEKSWSEAREALECLEARWVTPVTEQAWPLPIHSPWNSGALSRFPWQWCRLAPSQNHLIHMWKERLLTAGPGLDQRDTHGLQTPVASSGRTGVGTDCSTLVSARVAAPVLELLGQSLGPRGS